MSNVLITVESNFDEKNVEEVFNFCSTGQTCIHIGFGTLNKNHELGIHNDKMCTESSAGNAPNIPQFIRPISPNWQIIWDIFEKGPLQMSIVHGGRQGECYESLSCTAADKFDSSQKERCSCSTESS